MENVNLHRILGRKACAIGGQAVWRWSQPFRNQIRCRPLNLLRSLRRTSGQKAERSGGEAETIEWSGHFQPGEKWPLDEALGVTENPA